MEKYDFVTDARLSQAAYSGLNSTASGMADGWRAMHVDWEGYTPSKTFGSQLYEKNGQYKVVYRGTEANLEDWQQNGKFATGSWSDEWADTVVFIGKAIKQVSSVERIPISRS